MLHHGLQPGQLILDKYRVERVLGDFDRDSVWSVTAVGSGSGLHSTSQKHGDFDNDVATVESLKHILDQGY